MSGSTCTGQPVSWLALERHVLGELDADRAGAVQAHLDACAACRAALGVIESDRDRALPPLPDLALAAAARRRRSRRAVAAGAVAALAAAAALLLVWRDRAAPDARLVGSKGGDEVVIGLVRERGGDVALDPAGFRPGDRFKVLVTCARAGAATVEVSVRQAGSVDHPLAPVTIRCGNRVPVPGAFRLTGDQPASICASLGGASACRAVVPE
ncbi:MAG TPA: zf-HC2 domain-containing protein [Kofleriaceae bacterium]|nr:zf-HC2 domain-containing protein [Kofleriaceae bacterium]